MAQLAPLDQIAALRTPEYLFTDSYLNNPIEFPDDSRFVPETAVRQLNAYVVLPRDYANFVVVELNDATQQFYAASMTSPIYNRADFNKIINTAISQLPNSPLPNT